MVILTTVTSGAVCGGVGWVGVGCLMWLGGMDTNTTPILSPSPFLVMYK